MQTRMSYTIWFTGISGSGKTTLSRLTSGLLLSQHLRTQILDGDEVRALTRGGLGFTCGDREHQIRQLGMISYHRNANAITCVVAAISPNAQDRDNNRAIIPAYVEIYCRCDLNILIQRDPKGLYPKALRGDIQDFTGISSPYEEPVSPDLVLDTGTTDVAACMELIASALTDRGILA